ncbi:Glycosyltransferase involved in cell wall bisynthesis [Chitinophaga costaii]|uniref:Glycosyltransferase involved in cell wall bisynthesis n=1 Tax=Chitinophaga costaii TaxID=1335309 RepID=A0A1C4F7E3_9BACT|nr:glycosyltransferase family 4 protein [Chitinophaga costaii]PUZ21235.1 glycosyltransferase family 1 protein [Chitinophaga costaii]SCC51625.1 Glycosyltransferase involved in cell wall bisynthesis [Chitinophaga costaii]
MSKVLIYSDCFVFSGSENVIENMLKATSIKDHHDLSFYYAKNAIYAEGVSRKLTGIPGIRPLRIFSAYNQWGNQAQVRKKSGLPGARYLWVRYLLSYGFQLLGLHDCFNIWQQYYAFKKAGPDILYINNGGYPGARSCRVAVVAAHLAGISHIILNVNNLAFPSKGWLDRCLDKFIGQYVTVFVTASQAAGKQLMKLRGFDVAKWKSIPNTLNAQTEQQITLLKGRLRQEFQVPAGVPVIGGVGLLTARKGFSVLINAIHLLKTQYPDLVLPAVFIFGEGEDRRVLEELIRFCELEKNIFLPGFRNDILDYIKDMDLFVCPSIANEDFPYVVLEAMCMSKPVLGTRIAGIPEQIRDGYNGFIVPPSDASALCSALVKLLRDEPERLRMAQRSREIYFNRFNNTHVMRAYDQLFTVVSTDHTF